MQTEMTKETKTKANTEKNQCEVNNKNQLKDKKSESIKKPNKQPVHQTMDRHQTHFKQCGHFFGSETPTNGFFVGSF